MRRDMELIRKLLLYIEEQKGQFHSEDIKINGFDSDTINYQLKILFENNLITAIEIATNNRILSFYIITGMTWTGHELIDAIRNDNVWEQTLAEIRPLGSVAFDVIKTVASAIVLKTAPHPVFLGQKNEVKYGYGTEQVL